MRAFTLLELLVAIAVIAILIALAVPAFGRVRDRSRELVCVARVRTFGQAMTIYAHDYRGEPPSLVRVDTPPFGLIVPVNFQRFDVFASTMWKEYSGIAGVRDRLCPGVQAQFLVAAPDPNSDYHPTAALWLDPAFLDPVLTPMAWRLMRGSKIQALDSATFPSQKVHVYEWRVWHHFRGAYGSDVPLNALFYSHAKVDARQKPGTVCFVDGHAAVYSPRDIPWVNRWPTAAGTYNTTEHGMRGRDIPVARPKP